MLTIKAPIEIKCGRSMSSSWEAFGERILGNYQLIAAGIEREDLLHVVMSPPEVYIGGGALTSLVEDTRIQNVRESKLTVINNLLNRIAVTEEVKLSYQDRVYITDVLSRLGVTDVSQFMKQVFQLRQENRNVEELTELYWNHMEELHRTLEQYGGQKGVNRTVSETVNQENTLHLHEEIMNRLQTGAIYQILGNFYSARMSEQYISAQELNFAEQQRTVSRILLNRLETETVGERVPFVFRRENYYEENNLEGDQVTENAVNSQVTSAVLLNLVDSLVQNLSIRNAGNRDLWLSLENSLYQTAENTLQRMVYRADGQSVRVNVRQDMETEILRTQETEITALRQLLGLTERKEALPDGEKTAFEEAWTIPAQELSPADIRYEEAAPQEEEEEAIGGLPTERQREPRSLITERLERSRETLESVTERGPKQGKAEKEEKAKEKAGRGGKAYEQTSPREVPGKAEQTLPGKRAEAPAPVELTFLTESGEGGETGEESGPRNYGESREEEQLWAWTVQILNQYFAALYPQRWEAEETVNLPSLSYPRREEQGSAAAKGPEETLSTQESKAAASVQSTLENWQTPQQRKAGEQTSQPVSEFPNLETVLYQEGEKEPESEGERELIRERLERTIREENIYHTRQETAEIPPVPAVTAGKSREPEPGVDSETGEESTQQSRVEIDRRNIENYERYEQLLSTGQAEAETGEPESESERELIRERLERTLRETNTYRTSQEALEIPPASIVAAEPGEESQTGTVPGAREEDSPQSRVEIDRRNIEHYKRYEQLLKNQQEEAKKEQEKGSLSQEQSERLSQIGPVSTTLLEHSTETLEIQTERRIEEQESRVEEQSQEKAGPAGETGEQPFPQRLRERSEEAAREAKAEAPEPVELTFAAESGEGEKVREERTPGEQEKSETGEQPQAQTLQSLNQYFTSLYPQRGEAEETVSPVPLFHPRREEPEGMEAKSSEKTISSQEKGEAGQVLSILERWQTPQEQKAGEQSPSLPASPDMEPVLFLEGKEELENGEEQEPVRQRLERMLREGDVYQIRQEAAQTPPVPKVEARTEEEPESGDISETDEQILKQSLKEINRRNEENYERYQQFLKARQQEEETKKREKRPPLLKQREESLRALENPQQAIQEHQERVLESEQAASREDQAFWELLPEDTREAYQQLIQLQQSRTEAGQRGEAQQSQAMDLLERDIRQIERENTTTVQEPGENRREISEASKILLERSREYEEAAPPPGSRTQSSYQEMSLIHKSTESTLDEEELQEILARYSLTSRSSEVTKHVEEQHKVENTQVLNRTGQTSVVEQQDIEELIERGLRRQLGTLSDQVYTKLERRLDNEKKRRGY